MAPWAMDLLLFVGLVIVALVVTVPPGWLLNLPPISVAVGVAWWWVYA